LTISEADDAGAADAEPLLVVPVTRPLLRRVLDLVVEHVTPSKSSGVLPMRAAPPPTPEPVPDRSDP
jgi:hypothetical protein